MSYERARGLRAVGERADGFAVSVQRTVAVPVARLFDAVVDPGERGRWLPEGELRERRTTRPRSARFDWAGGASRVAVTSVAWADPARTGVGPPAGAPDAGEAERARAFWRGRLTALKAQLEAGGPRA